MFLTTSSIEIHLPPWAVAQVYDGMLFMSSPADCQRRLRVTSDRIRQPRRGMGSQP